MPEACELRLHGLRLARRVRCEFSFSRSRLGEAGTRRLLRARAGFFRSHVSEVAMDTRLVLPLAAAILLGGGALRSAVAHFGRSEGPEGPPALVAAGGGAFEAGALERAPPKPARQLFAHAIIVRTSPEKGSVAAQPVNKVEVWYDAGIRNDFVGLAVINASGDRVDKRDAAIDGSDPSHVSTNVEALAPGEYTVRYRAISADGHIVSGAWVFEVRQK
jgi:copper resistance protein C